MPATPLESDDPRSLGRFELAGRLGEGGQGVVYLGSDPSGERVAVKVLKTGGDAETRRRLARELAAARSVAPFCTARVIEAETEGSRPYVVSEFVDGPSLQDRVARDGPLRAGDLDRLLVGTASALAAIQGAGVLHRDLKPANVLLGPDGPRVVDFGIARPVDATTAGTNMVGTPIYMAPEVLGGHPPAPAADVFSWAATMVYAATGRPPFGKDALPAVLNRILNAEPDLAGVPPELAGLLATCLAKDPARRPTARGLLLHLVDPSAGLDATAPGQGAPDLARDAAHLLAGPPGHPQPGQPQPEWPQPGPPQPGPPQPGPPQPGPPQLGHPQSGQPQPSQPRPGQVGPVYGRPPGAGTFPHGPPATSPSPSPAPARRRGVLLGALAGGLVLVLGGAGLFLWLGENGDAKGAEGSRTTSAPATPGGGSGTSGGGSGTSGGGAGIPAAFGGTWSGTVSQAGVLNSGATYRSGTKITLTPGAREGRAEWSDWGCTATLHLVRASGTKLEFSESDVAGTCATGTITLTRRGDGLRYHWGKGPLGETADGDLRRS